MVFKKGEAMHKHSIAYRCWCYNYVFSNWPFIKYTQATHFKYEGEYDLNNRVVHHCHLWS